jgi:excisionase family DNA binding protein
MRATSAPIDTPPPKDRARSRERNGYGPSSQLFLSPREIADVTGLNVAVVRRAIARGELRAYKLCSRLRVHQKDFDSWIASNNVEALR